LHIHIPALIQVKLITTVGSRWTCFRVNVPITLDYPIINLNPRKNAMHRMINMHARPTQTDGRTDRQTDRWMEWRTNLMAVAWRCILMNATRA